MHFRAARKNERGCKSENPRGDLPCLFKCADCNRRCLSKGIPIPTSQVSVADLAGLGRPPGLQVIGPLFRRSTCFARVAARAVSAAFSLHIQLPLSFTGVGLALTSLRYTSLRSIHLCFVYIQSSYWTPCTSLHFVPWLSSLLRHYF